MLYLLILAFLMVLFILLFLLPLRLRVVIINSQICTEIYFCGICLHRKTAPDDSSEKDERGWHSWLQWKRVFKRILNSGKILRLCCRVNFGLGDMAATSQLAGVFWWALMIACSNLQRWSRFCELPDLKIVPEYHQIKWDFYFEGIFQSAIGYIMIGILENVIFGEVKGAEAEYERTSD